MELDQIANIFMECFQDASVFERSVGGTVVETDVIRKDNKKWVVVAAGIEADLAYDYFHGNPKRAERAGEPVTIIPNGRLSLFLVVRPVSVPFEKLAELDNVTRFAPGIGIPLVQIRQNSYVRCWDISDSNSRVHSLRWELDVIQARRDPQESWLKSWKRYLDFNPAHPDSHVHINALAFVPNSVENKRIEHSIQELRLGVGVPNPLALILSMAAWLRSLPNV